MSSRAALAAVVCCAILGSAGCRRGAEPSVVVYTALDRMFSEPILKRFEQQTGIRVRAKYDTESTKTVGLVNAIRAERRRPRCDVFWNNEIVNTIRLKQEGLLAPFRPRAAEAFPAEFRDADGYWTGFAARARVLVVNTNLVPVERLPDSVFDLADPAWKGRVGLAKPLFGTTATHAACLYSVLGPERTSVFLRDLERNAVQVQAGNRAVALSVGAGALAFGLTDTDDAMIERGLGSPVRIVFPDAGAGQVGVLFIPNSVALVAGAPQPEYGRALIEYLLSPEVEATLAAGPSAQIPLNPAVAVRPPIGMPSPVKAMEVDFDRAAADFPAVARLLEEQFPR